jgi:hypothetical protein
VVVGRQFSELIWLPSVYQKTGSISIFSSPQFCADSIFIPLLQTTTVIGRLNESHALRAWLLPKMHLFYSFWLLTG